MNLKTKQKLVVLNPLFYLIISHFSINSIVLPIFYQWIRFSFSKVLHNQSTNQDCHFNFHYNWTFYYQMKCPMPITISMRVVGKEVEELSVATCLHLIWVTSRLKHLGQGKKEKLHLLRMASACGLKLISFIPLIADSVNRR